VKIFLPLVFVFCALRPPPDTQIFILAGQSNMSGRGAIQAQVAVNGAWIFGNDWRWHPLTEPTDSAAGQVDMVSADTNAGYSMASSFAAAWLADHPGQTIAFVPCAKGGSLIADWQRSESRETLYGSCLARALEAEKYGTIAGVLWYQGESDAMLLPGAHVDDYWQFQSKLFNDFEQDFGPVTFAQIGTTTRPEYFPNWGAIQAQQIGGVYTADLPLSDFVHLSAQGYDELGERFYIEAKRRQLAVATVASIEAIEVALVALME